MISKYKLKNISKINFALLPTPLEKLTRLSNKYKINLFMKRDDLTGHCFGGNKERKLEYIFADAISKKAKTIITVGALQSNHCRMTSVFANKYNLKTELILIKNEKMSRNGGNYFLNKLAGANNNIVNSDEVKDKINELISLHQKEGNNPYFIEGGGHNELGTIAYIFAIKELQDQLDKIKLTPNFIILPTGTGTTQAGLILGAKIFNYDVNIIGISVSRKKKRCIEEISKIIKKTEKYLNIDNKNNNKKYSITVYDDYIGKGYGCSSYESIQATNIMLKKEGILIDPVYNAKAVAGMFDLILKKKLCGNIIYLNTGGLPLLFTKEYQNIY